MVIKIEDDAVFQQLNASSVLFNTRKLLGYGVKFNEEIKPAFEDGEFVARLCLLAEGECISFLPSAKYFYRKRSDGSSTLDKVFYDERRYAQLLDDAHLSLLSLCSDKKVVPLWLQNILFYEIFWNIKSVLTDGYKLNFMTNDFRSLYKKKLRNIISSISDDVILEFSLAGCWFYHKVGILGLFKDVQPDFSIAYIDSWDASKKLLCMRYFWNGNLPLESIRIGGEEIFPVYEKNTRHDFLGDEFVCERRIWVPFRSAEDVLSIALNEKESRISLQGKQFKSGVRCSQVLESMENSSIDLKKISIMTKPLRHQASLLKNKKKFKNAWIFMDRDTMADDNAEHLYRYVMTYHPEVNAFFVLRRASPDWGRLLQDGFRLLDFDSEDHHIALLNADFLLSSHADVYVVSPLSKKDFGDMLKYKYIFLQHGVTKDDLSKWFNSKQISLFVTATADEYQSIAGNGSKYKFGKNEVALTGFPRHDRLLSLSATRKTGNKKKIIIMPTWRKDLVGLTLGVGNQRHLNEKFFESTYAQCWKGLLHSYDLKVLADRFNADLIFYPHTNIDPYIDGFDVPDYFSIKRSSSEESMQKTFVETDVLITDYSSVAFEVAYLQKPVIYYQFDRDEVFSGGHIYEKGYFDYNVNGFGPVCLSLKDVLSSLEEYILEPNGEAWGRYRQIAEKTFAYRDGKCCERVFNAVRSLEEPLIINHEDQIAALRNAADEALCKGYMGTALDRYQRCFEVSNDEVDACNLLGLLTQTRRHGELLKLYERYEAEWSADTLAQCLNGLVALGCFRYVEHVLNKTPVVDVLAEYSESILKYAAWKRSPEIYGQELQKASSVDPGIIEILGSYFERDWGAVRAKLRFSPREVLLDHFDLFLQSCFRTNCVEYAENLFGGMAQEFSPSAAKIYSTRIQLASGDFDGALESYENICKTGVEEMCREDVDNWLKLRHYKRDGSLIPSETGVLLLRRFADDEDISCLIIEQTQFIKDGFFDAVLDIFSGNTAPIPAKVSLFIFKNLLSLHRFQEAELYVKSASFAALDDDKVLISDFQMMKPEILDLI